MEKRWGSLITMITSVIKPPHQQSRAAPVFYFCLIFLKMLFFSLNFYVLVVIAAVFFRDQYHLHSCDAYVMYWTNVYILTDAGLKITIFMCYNFTKVFYLVLCTVHIRFKFMFDYASIAYSPFSRITFDFIWGKLFQFSNLKFGKKKWKIDVKIPKNRANLQMFRREERKVGKIILKHWFPFLRIEIARIRLGLQKIS